MPFFPLPLIILLWLGREKTLSFAMTALWLLIPCAFFEFIVLSSVKHLRPLEENNIAQFLYSLFEDVRSPQAQSKVGDT